MALRPPCLIPCSIILNNHIDEIHSFNPELMSQLIKKQPIVHFIPHQLCDTMSLEVAMPLNKNPCDEIL